MLIIVGEIQVCDCDCEISRLHLLVLDTFSVVIKCYRLPHHNWVVFERIIVLSPKVAD